MDLHWNIRLLQTPKQDIPLVTLHSDNRGMDASFIDTDSGNFEHHFIDVGAHQGESIAGFVNYLRFYGITDVYSITSFEPSRQAQIWSPLTLTARKYAHLYSSMFISNYAVSANTGIAEFRDDGSAGSSLHKSKPLNRNETVLTVPTISIVDVLNNIPKNAQKIILKLNVEGAEYDILDMLIEDRECLSRINEIWLDFHGCQFVNKWVYLQKELGILTTLENSGVLCYDVDFMSGFYHGYENHPPAKHNVTHERLINAYM